MRAVILALLFFLLSVASAQSSTLSDNAGFRFTLTDNGSIDSVELNGAKLPHGGRGGFYLCEPNSETRVPMVGKTFSRDGKLQLMVTSPLQARLEASCVEGDGYIEIQGEL
jgi:hypothetical protein